jgi:hypothetical protein
MSGGKSGVQKVIIHRLQNDFKTIKDFVVNKNYNNIRTGCDKGCCNDWEDFSITKYDFEIVKYLQSKIWYMKDFIKINLNYLFTNEVSRDKYKNQKDFNMNEFKVKLINLNKNINLNFDVSAVITFNENGEMIYKQFSFWKIDCDENFEEMVNETRKKLEKIQYSFETITGEYNSQYQTLKDKMFEDVEKLFEEENKLITGEKEND